MTLTRALSLILVGAAVWPLTQIELADTAVTVALLNILFGVIVAAANAYAVVRWRREGWRVLLFTYAVIVNTLAAVGYYIVLFVNPALNAIILRPIFSLFILYAGLVVAAIWTVEVTRTDAQLRVTIEDLQYRLARANQLLDMQNTNNRQHLKTIARLEEAIEALTRQVAAMEAELRLRSR